MGNVFDPCTNQSENVMLNRNNEVVYKGRPVKRNDMVMGKQINNKILFKEFNKGVRKQYNSNENSRIKASFEEFDVDGYRDKENKKIKRINLVMNLLRDDDDYNNNSIGQQGRNIINDSEIANKNKKIINVSKRKYNSHKRVTFADNLLHFDNNLISGGKIKKVNSIQSAQSNQLEIFTNTFQYNSTKPKDNKPQYQIESAVSIHLPNKPPTTNNHTNTNTPYSSLETISSSNTFQHTRNSPYISQQSSSSGNIPLQRSQYEDHSINNVLNPKHRQYNRYKTNNTKPFNTIPIPLPNSVLSTHFSSTAHSSKTSSPLEQHQNQNNHSQAQSQPLPLSFASPRSKYDITVSFPKSPTQIDKRIISNNTNNTRLHLSYETLSQIAPSIIIYDGTLLKIQYTKTGYKVMPKYFQITKNCFRYYNSAPSDQATTTTPTPLSQFDIRRVCDIRISTINKMLKLKHDKVVFAFVIYLDYSNNDFFEFGVDDLNRGVDFIKVLTLIMNYHEDLSE